jgi:hypothetical protein
VTVNDAPELGTMPLGAVLIPSRIRWLRLMASFGPALMGMASVALSKSPLSAPLPETKVTGEPASARAASRQDRDRSAPAVANGETSAYE